MHYTTVLGTLLIVIVTVVAAVAVSSPPSAPLARRELGDNELILYGLHGRIEIVSRAEYLSLPDHVPIATAEQHNSKPALQPPKEEADSPTRTIEPRCPKETVWTLNPVETFIDWDIPMSGVIRAPPHDTATVNVASGYWIANSLTVTTSFSFSSVKKFLLDNFGINFAHGWTSSYSAGYNFKIPRGMFGTVVSNPLTIRHSGYADVGCIGKSERTEFTSDSYRGKSSSGMSWVEGIIGLCVGTTYPLPRCFGNGTL